MSNNFEVYLHERAEKSEKKILSVQNVERDIYDKLLAVMSYSKYNHRLILDMTYKKVNINKEDIRKQNKKRPNNKAIAIRKTINGRVTMTSIITPKPCDLVPINNIINNVCNNLLKREKNKLFLHDITDKIIGILDECLNLYKDKSIPLIALRMKMFSVASMGLGKIDNNLSEGIRIIDIVAINKFTSEKEKELTNNYGITAEQVSESLEKVNSYDKIDVIEKEHTPKIVMDINNIEPVMFGMYTSAVLSYIVKSLPIYINGKTSHYVVILNEIPQKTLAFLSDAVFSLSIDRAEDIAKYSINTFKNRSKIERKKNKNKARIKAIESLLHKKISVLSTELNESEKNRSNSSFIL